MVVFRKLVFAFAAMMSAIGVSMPATAATIVGGSTSVSLTAAPTLIGLGLGIAPFGTAGIAGSAPPVATFLITGGSTSGSNAIIRHDGSGLLFTAGTSSLSIGDFLINTALGKLTGKVIVNGTTTLMDVPLFDIGAGLKLNLTAEAAGAFTAVFGAPNLTGAEIGTATTNPVLQNAVTPVPEPGIWMMMIAGFMIVGLTLRRRRSAVVALA
jgi:hypothetical protein